jgi:hypothetical protein
MITQAAKKLYLNCVTIDCTGEWRVGQVSPGATVDWSCNECRVCFHIQRLDAYNFRIESTGMKDLPITVTLRSKTVPPITLKLNAWKYPDSQHDTKEEFEEHERYYFNEHTCPTNYMSQIEQIEIEGDIDPHGVFEFVSVEDGHFQDPNVIYPEAQKPIPGLNLETLRKVVAQLKNSGVKLPRPKR